MITFDDGYEGLLTEALPILSDPQIQFRATCFLPTGRLGGTSEWDAGDNQPVIRHLDWNQVESLHRTGWVDFQAHTVSHPNLLRLERDPSALAMELVQSREEIQTRLKKPVEFISWPHGAFNLEIIVAARRAGYVGALTDRGGVETSKFDPWSIKRIMIHQDGSMIYDPARAGYPFSTWLDQQTIHTPQR